MAIEAEFPPRVCLACVRARVLHWFRPTQENPKESRSCERSWADRRASLGGGARGPSKRKMQIPPKLHREILPEVLLSGEGHLVEMKGAFPAQ